VFILQIAGGVFTNIGLDQSASHIYHLPMDKKSPRAQAPAGWREAIDRSEAQAAAGEFVSGEDIMRELRESIVRMEAGRADDPPCPGCPSLSLIARRLQATAAANGMTADVHDELMRTLAKDD